MNTRFNVRNSSLLAYAVSSDNGNRIGIADAEWLYKYTFAYSPAHLHALLVFEGLDTICDVYLVCSA